MTINNSSLIFLSVLIIGVSFFVSLGVSIVYFSKKFSQDQSVISTLSVTNSQFTKALHAQKEAYEEKIRRVSNHNADKCRRIGESKIFAKISDNAESEAAAIKLYDNFKEEIEKVTKDFSSGDYHYRSVNFSVNDNNRRYRETNNANSNKDRYALSASFEIFFKNVDDSKKAYLKFIEKGVPVTIHASERFVGNCYDN